MEWLNFLLELIEKISSFIGGVLRYKLVYKATGLFFTRKFKEAKNNHKYAVLIAARNEETVIGNLIDSINQQDYPQELLTLFVVADNCTDNTAGIARDMGAICYERSDTLHRTKGYALQFLVNCIERDYGIDAFEGYFIFDADNLLKRDYVTRMNESFDSGQKIITSYRNTKNFGDNWISASYGIHWLRTIRNEHRARSVFHLATRIQGTGFLFANELIKNGWNYTSLTEDRAFCADAVAQGYQISYNNEAVFFDEQPISIKIAMRQRIRWAKGHLQALVETGPLLLRHIFITKGTKNFVDTNNMPWYMKLLYNLRLRFMSLDMLSVVYPRSLMLVFKKTAVFILKLLLYFAGWEFSFSLFNLSLLGKQLFSLPLESSVFALIISTIYALFVSNFKNVFGAAYVFIVEHKRIEHIPFLKKIWFCIMFPLFDIIGKLSLIIALFKKVEWKTIPHTSSVRIEDIKLHK